MTPVARPIRVLVAEDSAVTRDLLVFLIEEDPALQVVGTARDGSEAVELAERLKPDVILMDVHMPRMDGYEATRRIMERSPAPIVMASASLHRGELSITFEALKAGAVTVQAKPVGPGDPRHAETSRKLLETLRLMAEVKVVRRWAKPSASSMAPQAPPRSVGTDVRVVAIAASTGGPAVLSAIFQELPASLPAPILLVQHIAPGFVAGLADWLDETTSLRVKLAESDEMAEAGCVYVAPEARHLGISRHGRIALSTDGAEQGFCPSASFLFRSVAEAYGRQAMGVILTGMGRDGADGLLRLREAGGTTIAQDEESCVVFGMPGEAIRLQAAALVFSPPQITEAIGSVGGRQGGR